MKRKVLLPLMALFVAAAFSLGACGNKPAEGSESKQDDISQTEEVEIVVTAADGKVDLIVGETVQLTASVEGVTWKSRAEAVATISETGLVTAVGAGTVRIRAEKDGYATGTIAINVSKAPEREAKVTIGLENADHYSPNDFWGMNYNGTVYGPGESPVEDNGGATEDGTSLGWLQTGCKETLTFTCNKAVQVEIGVTMAYNAEMNLATALAVTFNDQVIDMTGKVCEGPEDGESYYDFHTVSFGNVSLINGNNVLVIEMIAQGPNMDEFKIFTEEDITVEVVKPVVLERIVVEPTSVSIEVGGSQQLTTATEGVTYTSADATIATVSATGLVEGVAAGKTEITVSKEGKKPATVAVQVKEPFVAKDYNLVEGEAVRLELEYAAFYCDAGSWGYPQWGIGPNHDGGETPIEDQESASNGMSLGYLSASTTITMKFNSPKAGNAAIVLGAAHANDLVLADCISLTVNSAAVSLADKTVTGGGSNNYYSWQQIDLGSCAVNNGENTLVITVIGSTAPNLDYVDLTLAA